MSVSSISWQIFNFWTFQQSVHLHKARTVSRVTIALTSTFDKFQYGFGCWSLKAHHWHIFPFGIDFPSIMFQSWFCGNIGLVPLGHVVCSKNVGYKCSWVGGSFSPSKFFLRNSSHLKLGSASMVLCWEYTLQTKRSSGRYCAGRFPSSSKSLHADGTEFSSRVKDN